MRIHRGLLAVALAGALVAAGCSSGGGQPDRAAPTVDTVDPVAFRQDMRVLWEDHVAWASKSSRPWVMGIEELSTVPGPF
jgi:hypothetical protein